MGAWIVELRRGWLLLFHYLKMALNGAWRVHNFTSRDSLVIIITGLGAFKT